MIAQDGRFTYHCPACCGDGEMRGDFGDDVTCPDCGRTFETDWDYTDAREGSMAAWIVREITAQETSE